MKRYAIYYAPPTGSSLARFGADWLGWDAETGTTCRPGYLPLLPISWEEITATPRRYGFHGTLKSPFRLSPGSTVAALEGAVAALARRTAPFETAPLAVLSAHGYVSLRPATPSAEMKMLAAGCVEAVDQFRAAPSDEELARRRSPGLTERQEALLSRWGYPYVFEEFQFHLTLSDSLGAELAGHVARAMRPLLAPHLGLPLPVREICLFGEPEKGGFRLLSRFALGD